MIEYELNVGGDLWKVNKNKILYQLHQLMKYTW